MTHKIVCLFVCICLKLFVYMKLNFFLDSSLLTSTTTGQIICIWYDGLLASSSVFDTMSLLPSTLICICVWYESLPSSFVCRSLLPSSVFDTMRFACFFVQASLQPSTTIFSTLTLNDRLLIRRYVHVSTSPRQITSVFDTMVWPLLASSSVLIRWVCCLPLLSTLICICVWWVHYPPLLCRSLLPSSVFDTMRFACFFVQASLQPSTTIFSTLTLNDRLLIRRYVHVSTSPRQITSVFDTMVWPLLASSSVLIRWVCCLPLLSTLICICVWWVHYPPLLCRSLLPSSVFDTMRFACFFVQASLQPSKTIFSTLTLNDRLPGR
jgi:hypothetical protein